MQVVLSDAGGVEYQYNTAVGVTGEWTERDGRKVKGFDFNPPLEIGEPMTLDSIILAPGSKREIVFGTDSMPFILGDVISSVVFTGEWP